MSLFDLYQHQMIRNTGKQVRANEELNDHKHRRSRDELDLLHARIDRLVLVNEAMWQLLAELADVRDDDLAQRINELDMVDGQLDGRRQAKATQCNCGAKINPKARLCQFCGGPPPERSPFEAV